MINRNIKSVSKLTTGWYKRKKWVESIRQKRSKLVRVLKRINDVTMALENSKTNQIQY